MSLEVLDKVLTEEQLTQLLENETNLENLCIFLQIKTQRIDSGLSERFPFLNSAIFDYKNELTTILKVVKLLIKTSTNIVPLIREKFLDYDENMNHIYYNLNLLNTLLENNCFSYNINSEILTLLQQTTTPCFNFILIRLIPNYIKISIEETSLDLINSLFDFIQRQNKLDALCLCYDTVSKFSDLIKSKEFDLLILKNLGKEQHKQAVFLLQKSRVQSEQAKAWSVYFTLLSLSSEKQLHLLEPALNNLNGILNLDREFRCCLYKILLQHSQSVAIYQTSTFILEYDAEIVSFVCLDLLSAINRNEYNLESNKIFEKIAYHCKDLGFDQIEDFLKIILSIQWVPVAIWSLCYQLFYKNKLQTKLSMILVENIIKNLRALPHKFIRNACIHIVCLYNNLEVPIIDEVENNSCSPLKTDVLEIENYLNELKKHSGTDLFFENLKHLFEFIDNPLVVNFISNCLDEFVIVHKNISRNVSKNFLHQIFQCENFVNPKFLQIVVEFSKTLLLLSNSSNSFAFFLSKNIAALVKCNPCLFIPFSDIICELFFYGILVSKTERVDYYVCQEITKVLQLQEESPYYLEMSTRFWAIESLLIFINIKPDNFQSAIDNIALVIIQKYQKNFAKRYFPDSQVHLEKIRALQILILINKTLSELNRTVLIELIMDSFLAESHQTSVKHLFQWLLFLLIKKDDIYFIENVILKLETVDNKRPSTVTGFIPILYNLFIRKEEDQWDKLVEILLPYTMGAQFKLRIVSQIALHKIFENAVEKNYNQFLLKYNYLYKTIQFAIEATQNAGCDIMNFSNDFLEYFSIESIDFSSLFYTVLKRNEVSDIEYDNLISLSSFNQFDFFKFDHFPTVEKIIKQNNCKNNESVYSNIQKKITPWQDSIKEENENQITNDFILVTSLIEKSTNLGGLSRSCEVFGIKKIVMRTSKIITDKEFKSLSMSSENWVEITEVKAVDLQEFILEMKKKGYEVIGAEQTTESEMLDRFQFFKKTVLLLGNEKHGIPADLIPLLDKCIEIPQFGVVRSLNVHVAGAILMWEYCKQYKL